MAATSSVSASSSPLRALRALAVSTPPVPAFARTTPPAPPARGGFALTSFERDFRACPAVWDAGSLCIGAASALSRASLSSAFATGGNAPAVPEFATVAVDIAGAGPWIEIDAVSIDAELNAGVEAATTVAATETGGAVPASDDDSASNGAGAAPFAIVDPGRATAGWARATCAAIAPGCVVADVLRTGASTGSPIEYSKATPRPAATTSTATAKRPRERHARRERDPVVRLSCPTDASMRVGEPMSDPLRGPGLIRLGRSGAAGGGGVSLLDDFMQETRPTTKGSAIGQALPECDLSGMRMRRAPLESGITPR